MLVRFWAAFLVLTTSVAAQSHTGHIAVGTATLSGRIVEPDSREPVVDVVVTLASVSASGSLVTQTDRQGRYVFEDVAAGNYRLTARHPEYAPEIYGMNLGTNPAALEPIVKLSAQQRRTDVDFTLVREGRVAGRVTSAGEAIRGARISAIQMLDSGILISGGGGGSVTNERGEYLLSNLPGGLYFIAVQWTDHDTRLPSPTETQQMYFPGVDTTKDAATVRVGTGQTAADVDIVMRSTTRVRLTGHILRGPGEGTINAYLLPPRSSFHNVIDPLRRDRVDVGPGGRFEVKAMFGERVLRVINLDTGWSVGRILQGETPVKSLTAQPEQRSTMSRSC